MKDAESYNYENRYIAFLDLLGFSEHIDGSRSDQSQVRAIAKVLEFVEMEKEFNDQQSTFHSGNSCESLHMFSDSIVLTAPVTDFGLTRIFLKVSSLLRGLLDHAALIRGAIVQGEIYEKDHITFGPGLIEAYKLESSAARYPRIIVSEEIHLASQSVSYNVDGRESMLLDKKIRRDFDGLHYLDWMLHYHSIYEPGSKGFRIYEGPGNYLGFKEAIEFALEDAAENPAVRSKIFWLANYFNSVIERGKVEELLGVSRDIAKIEL